MAQEKYDIFISYRRDGGIDKAQLLKFILTSKGYRVFMDVHELTYGVFGNHIKEAIDSAPVFLVLLTPNALDRCVNADDWVRKEIEYAVEKRKCIIPINPNGSFDTIPDKLPETIKLVLDIHNYASVDFVQSLDSSMNDLIERWITPAIKAEEERIEKQRKAEHEAYLLSLPDVEFTPFKTKGKFGYKIKSTGESATACEYDKVTSFNHGIAAVKKGGLWGYINKSGKVVIEIKYDKANSVVNGVAEVELHNQKLYYNANGEELSQDYILSNDIFPSWKTRLIKNKKAITIGCTIIALFGFFCSFIPFINVDTHIGGNLIVRQRFNLSVTYNRNALFTSDGTKLTPFKYTHINHIIKEGLLTVGYKGKYGIINTYGKEVTPLKYDGMASFDDDLAMVNIGGKNENGFMCGGKWGFIDKTGKEVTPIKYDAAYSFSDGLARVELDGKFGYIDKTGKELTSLKYDNANDFFEGLAMVGLNGKGRGFIDITGEEVIPLKYEDAYIFSDGLAAVKLDGKYGFIDKTGEEIIDLKYDNANDFCEGLAVVRMGSYSGGKYGFVDKTGKEIIHMMYDFAGSFSKGLALVKLNGKGEGFIDNTGKEVIPLKYEDAYPFSDGLAAVKLDGKWGFINRGGKEVISFKYDEVQLLNLSLLTIGFSEGLALVKLNGKGWGFVDNTGNEVIPLKYEDAYPFSDGLAAVKLDGKWGYINKKGRKIISFKYDEAGYFMNGKALVKTKNIFGVVKEFYIDKNGKKVE